MLLGNWLTFKTSSQAKDTHKLRAGAGRLTVDKKVLISSDLLRGLKLLSHVSSYLTAIIKVMDYFRVSVPVLSAGPTY